MVVTKNHTLALTRSPSINSQEDLYEKTRNDLNRLSGAGTDGVLGETTPVYQVGLSPKIFKRGI